MTAIPEFTVKPLEMAAHGLLAILDRAVARHGPLVRLRVDRGQEVVLLGDAAHVRYWASHPDHFGKDVDRTTSSASVARLLLEEALTVTREGEEWRRARVFTTPLVSHTAPYMTRDIHACAEQLAVRLRQLPADAALGDSCMAWSVQLVCRPLMGPGMDEAGVLGFANAFRMQFYALLMKAARAGDSRTLTGDPDLLSLRARMDELTAQLLTRQAPTDSMIGRLLAELDPALPPAEVHRIVRNTVVGTFTASVENNSTALHWCLLHLAQQPEWQQALQDEAEDLDYQDWHMQQAPVALACVREALRLTPVSPVLERSCTRDIDLDGRSLAAGQAVLFSPWVVHRSEQNWPNALTFDPSRGHGEAGPLGGSYFPFGVGKRVCIGMNLSLSQLTLAVSLLLREFHFQLAPTTRAVDCKPVFRNNLTPRGTVRFRLSPRHAIRSP
jgi:cytochrome P450